MYYSIGTFSKLTGTTIAALRFYDREGIFRPAYTDKNTGYRYYLSSIDYRLNPEWEATGAFNETIKTLRRTLRRRWTG